MKPIIYNFTNIAPLYRSKLWATLLQNKSFDFHYFFGQNNTLGIKTIDFQQELFKRNNKKLHRIKNHWFKKKYLIWQSGIFKTYIIRQSGYGYTARRVQCHL